jgi:hypothetical protein
MKLRHEASCERRLGLLQISNLSASPPCCVIHPPMMPNSHPDLDPSTGEEVLACSWLFNLFWGPTLTAHFQKVLVGLWGQGRNKKARSETAIRHPFTNQKNARQTYRPINHAGETYPPPPAETKRFGPAPSPMGDTKARKTAPCLSGNMTPAGEAMKQDPCPPFAFTGGGAFWFLGKKTPCDPPTDAKIPVQFQINPRARYFFASDLRD